MKWLRAAREWVIRLLESVFIPIRDEPELDPDSFRTEVTGSFPDPKDTEKAIAESVDDLGFIFDWTSLEQPQWAHDLIEDVLVTATVRLKTSEGRLAVALPLFPNQILAASRDAHIASLANILTVDEAARELEVPLEQMDTIIGRRLLNFHPTPEGEIRIRRIDVEHYLRSNEPPPPPREPAPHWTELRKVVGRRHSITQAQHRFLHKLATDNVLWDNERAMGVWLADRTPIDPRTWDAAVFQKWVDVTARMETCTEYCMTPSGRSALGRAVRSYERYFEKNRKIPYKLPLTVSSPKTQENAQS